MAPAAGRGLLLGDVQQGVHAIWAESSGRGVLGLQHSNGEPFRPPEQEVWMHCPCPVGVMLLCRNKTALASPAGGHVPPALGLVTTVVLLPPGKRFPGGTHSLPHMVLSSVSAHPCRWPGMCPAIGPAFPPQASCGSCRFSWDAHEGLGPLLCPQPIRGEHAVSLMGSEAPGMCAALLSCVRLRPVLRLLVSFPACPHVSCPPGESCCLDG